MVVLVFIELAFSRTGTGRQLSVETALLEFPHVVAGLCG